MKKIILSLALVAAFSTSFVSCRDTNKKADDMEDVADDVEDSMDDAGDAIEDAVDDTGDAIEEGVDEVKENTGTGGTDDM